MDYVLIGPLLMVSGVFLLIGNAIFTAIANKFFGKTYGMLQHADDNSRDPSAVGCLGAIIIIIGVIFILAN